MIFVTAVAMPSLYPAFAVNSFDEAIKKHRNTQTDEVGSAQAGLPHFSIKTLNPVWTWKNSEDLVAIPKLTLLNQDGKTVTDEMFRGKTTFVSFMFTSCIGFCPTLTASLKSLASKFNSISDVQYVAMSVDTERDTPTRLKQYFTKMKLDNRWTLLTGDHDAIYGLARNTFASQAFQRKDTEERNFAHSEHVYLIDRDGFLRAVLNGTRQDIAKQAGEALKQLHTR